MGVIEGWPGGGVSLSDAMLVAPLGGEGGRCFSDVCNVGLSVASRGDLSCWGVDIICPDIDGDPVDEVECVCSVWRPICGSVDPFVRKSLAWELVTGVGDVGFVGDMAVEVLLALLA